MGRTKEQANETKEGEGGDAETHLEKRPELYAF
jgi:hypothetical protein